MGVVAKRYIYKFPHITYPYSTCISSFLQQHPYFFVDLKNVFQMLFSLFKKKEEKKNAKSRFILCVVRT